MTYLAPPALLPPGSVVDSYRRDSGGSRQEKSTAQQLSEIRAFCKQYGLQLRHAFVDDAKSGGSTAGRDDFNRMMELYRQEEDRPAGLLLWNYARFARDFDDAVYFKALLRKWQIAVHSMNDAIPEGPYGRIVELFIDLSDEEKRRQTSADTKRGLHDLVRLHGCVPGSPPTGFKRERVVIGRHRDGDPRVAHRWIPDPELAPRILKAFQMRASGATLGQIHGETHVLGSINSYATFWPNKIYIGTLEFGDQVYEHYCEPIVPQAIFLEVQRRQNGFQRQRAMKSGSIDHPRRASSRFLLSGLARCGRCGSPLYGHSSHRSNGKTLDSYFCTRAWRKRDCVRNRIPRDAIETAVLNSLTDYVLLPDTMRAAQRMLKRGLSSRLAEEDEVRRSLAAALKSVRHKKANVVDAIAEQHHSRALLERLAAIEAEEADLITRQAALEAAAARPVPEVSPRQLSALLKRLSTALQTADVTARRSVLRGFIDHVDVLREGHALRGTIVYYYPPPDPSEGTPPGPVGVPTSLISSGPPSYRHPIPHPFLVQLRSASHSHH